jgi:transposase
MPKAISVEVRNRVVQAHEDGEGSFAELGTRFAVGEASVNRWVARKRRTGNVEPDAMGGARGERLIDAAGEVLIAECLAAVPTVTMAQLTEVYAKERGVTMSSETMRLTVVRLGYTRKKGLYAPQRQAAKTS